MTTNQHFVLEIDDRCPEERQRDEERLKAKKKRDPIFSALGDGKSEIDKGPMDSTHLEDLGEPEIEIRLNLGNIRAANVAREQESFSALGDGKSEIDKGPMDSTHLEDLGFPDPNKIRLNLGNVRDANDAREQESFRESFRERLFNAVSERDVNRLDGVQDYLLQNGKKLSDSLYRLSGKTPLVKALLNLKNGKNDTVKELLRIAEEMGGSEGRRDLETFVNAPYTDSYYFGQTALHVAIERRSKHFVELLVEKGADVHARACGKFFQQHDGACFYFGELPLSLAACTNQRDIVDFLLENPYQRADVRKTDSQGNTVLHALVVVADDSPKNTVYKNTDFITKMYDHILTKAVQLNLKENLEEMENNQGLTPIKLAAKTGKIELLKHIMHREFHEKEYIHFSRKFIEWAYGPVYASLYDLKYLDSFEKNSVLEIVVYGSEIPKRLEILQVEPLSRLLDEKWNRFAHRIFLFKFLVYVLYLCTFTCVAYFGNRRMSPQTRLLHAAGQQLSFWGSVYLFFKELIDIKRRRPNLQSLLIDGYFELIFFLQALLCIISFVLYWCGQEEHLCFLVLSLALGWLNLLYFSRGFRHMGIYSVMIQKILLGDIMRFLLVYIVFLFGFSAAVVTLMNKPEELNATNGTSVIPSNQTSHQTDSECAESDKASYHNFYSTTLELFKFTIGMGNLECTDLHRYKQVFYVLLISYIVLTYILLLNMLIALMSQTVQKLTEESTNIWKLQRAITILDMERILPLCLKKRLRSGVQKNLGTAGDDKRWCLRVEESQVKDWDTFNTDLNTICEDPGIQKYTVRPALKPTPEKAKGWGRLRRATVSTRFFSSTEHVQLSP